MHNHNDQMINHHQSKLMVMFIAEFNNDVVHGDYGGLAPEAGLDAGPPGADSLTPAPLVEPVPPHQDDRLPIPRRRKHRLLTIWKYNTKTIIPLVGKYYKGGSTKNHVSIYSLV